MARADSECRAYERELRYQSEEKERREWEQEQIDKIETHVEQSKKEWHTRMNETSRVRLSVRQRTGAKLVVSGASTYRGASPSMSIRSHRSTRGSRSGLIKITLL